MGGSHYVALPGLGQSAVLLPHEGSEGGNHAFWPHRGRDFYPVLPLSTCSCLWRGHEREHRPQDVVGAWMLSIL